MLEDVARIHLLAGDDAEVALITTSLLGRSTEEEPALAALHIKKGHLVLKDGVALPVVGGRTAVADFLDQDGLKSLDVLNTPLSDSVIIKDGLFVAGHHNYYHFLVYFLPGLLFLKARPRSPDGFLRLYMSGGAPKSLETFLAQFLPMLGGAPVTMTQLPDGVYSVRDILFPTLPKLFTPALVCRRVVLPLVMHLAGIAGPSQGAGALKLFVRRVNAPGGRNLTNQDEVEAWFAARGFTPVDPGALSFEDQVLLFARATHIAGVEGAAMANILFAVQAREIFMISSPAVRQHELFGPLLQQYSVGFKTVFGKLDPLEPKRRAANYHLPLAALDALQISG